MKPQTGRSTASRRGTGMSSNGGLKDALTDTLVKKMREKFADVALDVRAQDIIGNEVVGFMMSGGSVRDEDINALEERIRQKLSGGTAKPLRAMVRKKENDEWSLLAKYESEQNILDELKKKEKSEVMKQKMRQELDMQLEEVEGKKLQEKEREAFYAAEETRALEEWKEEEKAKLNKKQAQMQRLKVERDAQLLDQKDRREREGHRRKQEEDDAKEMLRMEHKRKMQEDADNKLRSMQEMDALKIENAKSIELMDERKQMEMKEDLMYQKKMAQMLDKQERDRRKKVDEIKKKQESLSNISEPRPLKKWMDESIIERNAEKREEMLDRLEDEKADKAMRENLEMRKVLAAQLQEKDARKSHASAVEAARVTKFNQAIKSSEAREHSHKDKLHQNAVKNKKELEDQMRENAMRRNTEAAMNSVEKTLNTKLLQKADHIRR